MPGSVPQGAGAVPALRGVFPGVSFFRVRASLGVSEMTEEKGAVAASWAPDLYGRFSGHRRRAAVELLARVPPENPGLAFDLGCGAGDATRLIAKRWPSAVVRGIDSSPDMLARARSEGGGIEWIEADMEKWIPDLPPGLVFANASLQWIEGHEVLFPKLAGFLVPGGALAAQMPLSRGLSSHVLMRETLASCGPGGGPVGPEPLRREVSRRRVLDPADYFDLLAPLAASLDIWETEYIHVLRGEDPVFAWVRATGLRPVLGGLSRDDLSRFLDAYRPALRAAYPRRPDGSTLYPFRRLFIVAVLD